MNADSKLVEYVFWVKNFTHMTDKKINKVTIHHQAGAASPQRLAQMFNGDRQASSNYGISNDGVISQMVREADRAWTSGSSWNDGQAVTIEVANCSGAPDWKIGDKAWQAMIDLCADICVRNGIVPSYDGTINATFTEHRMFQATACPGPYIHDRMKEIVRQVKAKMSGMTPDPKPQPAEDVMYKVMGGAFSKKASATRQANNIEKKTGVKCAVIEEGNLFKVQCGAFKNKENAVRTCAKVKQVVPDAYIREVKV